MAADGNSFWVTPPGNFGEFANVSLATFNPTSYAVTPSIDQLVTIPTFANTNAIVGVSYADGLGLSLYPSNADGTLNTHAATNYNWLLLETSK
jgi:hypothetical protein